MNLYSLIAQKPVNPNEIYKKIGYIDVANSLTMLIKNKFEELKVNDVFYNNFTSLASTTILIAQNKEQNSEEKADKLKPYLFSKDFVTKFNELVNERQQTSNTSS